MPRHQRLRRTLVALRGQAQALVSETMRSSMRSRSAGECAAPARPSGARTAVPTRALGDLPPPKVFALTSASTPVIRIDRPHPLRWGWSGGREAPGAP